MSNTDLADWQTFTLGTDWKEYSFVVTATSVPELTLKPALKLAGPGKVWVDLFQVVPVR